MSSAAGSSCWSVPVDHLDYSFIQNCSDLTHLERILRVLRSGQEGCYPHLMEFCERHIEKLNPRCRALRKESGAATPACFSSEEWRAIAEDLQLWERDVCVSDAELKRGPVCRSVEDVPPVRRSCTDAQTTDAHRRAAGVPRAYRDWDRFDVDAECAKIDKSEEQPRPERPAVVETHISTALTPQEKELLARREKDKGNEAFRSGDCEEAVAYYSRSVALSSSAAALNNRAQALIRLQRWTEALSDCEAVLQLEPQNVKALLRRATVHKNLGHLKESHDDLRDVLQIEPHNTTALKLLMDETHTDQRQETRSTGRKMLIQEEEDAQTEGRDCGIMADTHSNMQSDGPNVCVMKDRRRVCIIEVEDEDEDPPQACADAPPSILQPTNAFEFGQALSAARCHDDLLTCAELLRRVEPHLLPQFISTQLDAHTFSFIIRALDTHLLHTHPALVYTHLQQLCRTHRLTMVLMLLGREERSQLSQLFHNLCVLQTDAFSPDDITHLASKYI